MRKIPNTATKSFIKSAPTGPLTRMRSMRGRSRAMANRSRILAQGQRESDADGWTTMQQWLLRLRRRGVSVLVVHHAGKNGEQRGISNREDVARYLDQPAPPQRLQPGRRRALRGPRRQGSRAARQTCPAVRGEARNPCRSVDLDREGDRGRRAPAWVKALLADGMSIRDIAEETVSPGRPCIG